MQSRNMKILHVFRTYFPGTYGGAEQAIRDIAHATARLGVCNRIIHTGHMKAFESHEFAEGRTYAYPKSLEIASNTISLGMLMAFPKFADWADVIHYHFPWPFGDVLQTLASNKPYVVTYHSDIVRQRALLYLYWPLMRRFLSGAKVIIATSPNYLASSPILHSHRSATRVIPICLDEARYPTPDSARVAYWRERFGNRFFLFVGVLRYYKGLHILVEAARKLNMPIVIVGAGPIENDLKARADSLGLTNIHFLGFNPTRTKLRSCNWRAPSSFHLPYARKLSAFLCSKAPCIANPSSHARSAPAQASSTWTASQASLRHPTTYMPCARPCNACMTMTCSPTPAAEPPVNAMKPCSVMNRWAKNISPPIRTR